MREREKGRRRENRENWRVPRERGIKKETGRDTETGGQLDKASCVWYVCVCVCERERETDSQLGIASCVWYVCV